MRYPNPTILPDDLAFTLHALGLDPAEIVAFEPLRGGISEAGVYRMTLERALQTGGVLTRRYVVKRLLPAQGWLGAASRDTRIREVALRSTGVLSSLPRGIATATEAWAREGSPESPSSGALLLHDERGHLLRNPLRSPVAGIPPMVAALLDHLAWMHARFWEDSHLDDPRTGLMPADAALLLTSPPSVRAALASGDRNAYLPQAEMGWEAFFRLAPAEAGKTLQAVIKTPIPWAAATERLPRTLIHGDVWGPNLGWLPPTHRAPRAGRRLLLLDWALATAGPATYDPLWLCGTWHELNPARTLAFYRARLTWRLAAHGIRLAPRTWLALADAGYLRTALSCGEALGRGAAQAPAGAARRHAQTRVRWWAERAALAAHRLSA